MFSAGMIPAQPHKSSALARSNSLRIAKNSGVPDPIGSVDYGMFDRPEFSIFNSSEFRHLFSPTPDTAGHGFFELSVDAVPQGEQVLQPTPRPRLCHCQNGALSIHVQF